ncbi:MAG TPA: hypothetical protein GX512_01890 [Firmicutes bacterium]|nr:hypothetical protein [Candidatus Fermentithermobacillaceae bacterium]
MWNVILAIILVLLAVYISMTVRVNRIQAARARKTSYEERSSPLSEAIKDFVAVAGGVYLGLSAMAEFLKVPVPMQATIWGTQFDPVALFSICLAILAPIISVGKNRL